MGQLNHLLLLILITGISAQGFASTTKTKASSAKTSLPAFNLSLTIDASSSLHELNSGERSTQSNLYIDPKFNLNEKYNISGRLIYVQELAGVQNSYFENSYININRSAFQLTEKIKLAPTLRGYLPTKEKAREEQSYQGGAQARFSFLSKIKPFGAVMSTIYRISFLKNFHAFETRADGSQNTSWSVGHLLGFSKTFMNEKVEISALGSYSAGYTYNGELRTIFAIGQELAFSATDKLAFAIGHTNEANALKANGVDSNITAFDENTSYVYGSMTMKF